MLSAGRYIQNNLITTITSIVIKMEVATTSQDNKIVELNAGIDPRLLQKIQCKFTTEQQQLFVQSFALYAQSKDKSQFVISLDNIWEWLGFSTKQKAKELLTKNFDKNIHFTCIDVVINPQVKNPKGGRPTETILMTVETFKGLCMLANTDKAKVVRQYYITLEDVVQEYIYEASQHQARLSHQQALLQCYDKKHINYLGIFTLNGEQLAKYGWTDDAVARLKEHLTTFGQSFVLHTMIECSENRLLEKKFCKHPVIASRRVERVINNKKKTELIKLDDNFDVDNAKNILLDIKKNVIDKLLEYKQQEQQRNCDLERDKMKHLERMQEIELEKLRVQLEIKKLEHQQPPLREQATVMVPGQRAVLQYDLDNNLIARHSSITDAVKAVGGKRQSISAVCCQKRKTHRGFTWKYT